MLFFFYGSLRTGCKNHKYIKDGLLLGECTVKGFDLFTDKMTLIPTICPGKGEIKGEVWEIDDEQFIFRFERGYLHKTVDTPFGQATLFYTKSPKKCKFIESPVHIKDGDYKAYVKRSPALPILQT